MPLAPVDQTLPMSASTLKEQLKSGEIELISATEIGRSDMWKEFQLIRKDGEIQKTRVYCQKCLQGFKIYDASGITSFHLINRPKVI